MKSDPIVPPPVCDFDLAFRGPCGEPAITIGRCEKHRSAKCASCGKPAVRECDASIGLCCGYPLCGDCVHSITGRHQDKHAARRNYLSYEIELQQSRATKIARKIAELERERDAIPSPTPTQSDRLAALGRHPSNSPFAMQKS